MTTTTTKEITGRHVLIGFLSFFGVIIVVNLVMAWNAVRTFPGVEVANSYVASQGFNSALAAQQSLGWDVAVTVEDGLLVVRFADTDGAQVDVAQMTALLGRPTHQRDDQVPDFVQSGSTFVAPVTMDFGNWNLRITATAADGTLFRQRVSFWHRG
jgi:nitrogen fixation protein FixH